MKINDEDQLSPVFQKTLREEQLPTHMPKDGSKTSELMDDEMDEDGKEPDDRMAEAEAESQLRRQRAIKEALEASLVKHDQVLEDILKDYPTLTREKAVEMLWYSGFY